MSDMPEDNQTVPHQKLAIVKAQMDALKKENPKHRHESLQPEALLQVFCNNNTVKTIDPKISAALFDVHQSTDSTFFSLFSVGVQKLAAYHAGIVHENTYDILYSLPDYFQTSRFVELAIEHSSHAALCLADEGGRTPLMVLASLPDAHWILPDLLHRLEINDVQAIDNTGCSALDYAKKGKQLWHAQGAELLGHQKARVNEKTVDAIEERLASEPLIAGNRSSPVGFTKHQL